MRKFVFCFLSLSLLFTHLIAQAADEVDEIVVSAFRINATPTETGTSVWIVDDTQIKERGYQLLTDVLTSVPGLTVNQNGAFGGVASARIRGSATDQTLVLVDGVIVNDASAPGGGFDFSTLDVTDIQRVEVLKGPQSTLWGSDAIGGVVNIVSKQAETGLQGNVAATGGSFGTRQFRAGLSGGNDVIDFRLNATDFETDGISKADDADGNTEKDAFDTQNLSAKLGVNITPDIRLQLNHRSADTLTEFDSFGLATGVQDGDEKTDSRLESTQLTALFDLFAGRMQNMVKIGDTSIERQNFTAGVAGFGARGERQVLQLQSNVQVTNAQQFAVGFESEETSTNGVDASQDGLFALYKVIPRDNLTLSMGLRRDDHDVYGAETVARVGTSLQVNPQIQLRGSWSEGFKAPTIFQTTFFCCGATTPNPMLTAESSEAWDIGFGWTSTDADTLVDLTYFNQDTRDQINFSFALGSYENIDVVESRGIELAAETQLLPDLNVAMNLAYIDSVDGTGSRLIRIPRLSGDLAMTWQVTDKIQGTMVAVHNGDEVDSRGIVPGWTRVDISAQYQVSQNLRLFARIENLADRDYQQVFGYGTPERSAYVGLNYAFR